MTTSANTLMAGTLITSGGSWECREGDSGTRLTLNAEAHEVSWAIHLTTLKPGSGANVFAGIMDLPKGDAAWFVYLESRQRLWFFNGSDELVLREVSGNSVLPLNVISAGKAEPGVGEVPAELISRLPENLQKLFPKPDSSSPRPSI